MKTFSILASSLSGKLSGPHHRTTAPPHHRLPIFKLFGVLSILLMFGSCQKNEKDFKNKKDLVSATERRDGSCFTNDLEGICPFNTPQLDTFELDSVPGYPVGCKFYIEFEYVECNWAPDPRIFYFAFDNFRLIDVDCAQYDSEVDDVLFNPGIGIPSLEDYMNDLYDKLFERLTDEIFYQFYPHFECGVGDQWVFLQWIRESCYRYCAYRTGGEGSYIATPVPCGTGCCMTQTEICWQSTPGIIKKIITTTQTQSGECDPPNSTPPSGCIQTTPCRFQCE